MRARMPKLASLTVNLALLLALVPSGVAPTVAQSHPDSVGAAPSTVQRMPGGAASAALTATATADAENVEFVGHIGGDAEAVFVADGYAYVGLGYELAVVNASNPLQPQQIGCILFPDPVVSIYVEGGFAYVAQGGAGMRIVSVSDPSQPIEVGYYDTSGHPSQLKRC